MDGARALLRRSWPLLALALAVRVAQIFATRHWTPVGDPADYVRHAVSIAHHGLMAPSFVLHGGPSALRPPAYPYFLGGVFAVSGDSLTAGRLASALLGVISVALIGVIARMLWTQRVALIAMAVAAVYPPLVLLSGTLLSESLALPLVLALLALVLAWRDGARARWLVPSAGLLFGLALLDRPALVMFAVPLVAGLWGRPWRSWQALRAPVVALVVAGLAIVPWTVRNAVDFNAFVPISTQSGFLLAGTYNHTSDHDTVEPAAYRPANFDPRMRAIMANRSLDENQISRRLAAAGRDYAKDHPGYVPRVLWLNGLRVLGLYHGSATASAAYAFQGIGTRYAKLARWSWYPLVLVAIAGLALGAARRVPWWVRVMPLLLYLSVIWISGDIRYRAPIEPFVVWGAAYALAQLARVTGRRPPPPPRPTPQPLR
jgi:4-amino-4-deoxy-L-arabinose transferase-like glycosyltransferase